MSSEFGIAVHALVFLYHKGTIVSSEALAENVCTNPARIRKILSKLKKGGLVRTREGAEGGYLFAADAAKVTLAEICRLTETRLVASAWRSGDVDMDCVVASGMGSLMDGIYESLNSGCMERLEKITLLDVNNRLFGSK